MNISYVIKHTYFNLKHDIFSEHDQVVFVIKHNQTATVLQS